MHRYTLKDGEKMTFAHKRHCDCYADEEHNGCIRSVSGTSMDMRSYIKELWCKFINPNEVFPEDDDEFDEMLNIELQSEQTVEGIIAYLYQQMATKADLYQVLKEYEDMEENGQLIKMPFKYGQELWFILGISEDVNIIESAKYNGIDCCASGTFLVLSNSFKVDMRDTDKLFTTEEEAKRKLSEMEGKQ